MPLHLEVAVFSGAYGLMAQNLGAKRIELNAPGSYDAGGLTPPVSELTSIASQLEIPVRIMIRPRGPPQPQPQPQAQQSQQTTGQAQGDEADVEGQQQGQQEVQQEAQQEAQQAAQRHVQQQAQAHAQETQDFIYNDDDIVLMHQAILDFKDSKVMNPVRGDAFVFGILKPQDNPRALAKHPEQRFIIDEERCRALINTARPFPCIFHRAFDWTAGSDRWAKGLEALIRCGFEGVLTSGGAGGCADNLKRLDQIVHRTIGKLQIIAGGGVRRQNVKEAVARLSVHGAKNVWMHTASLAARTTEPGAPRNEELDPDELLMILEKMSVTTPA